MEKKRTMCKFFLQDKCKRGSMCGFMHSKDEEGEVVPEIGFRGYRKMAICKFFQQRKCMHGQLCPYGHFAEELLAASRGEYKDDVWVPKETASSSNQGRDFSKEAKIFRAEIRKMEGAKRRSQQQSAAEKDDGPRNADEENKLDAMFHASVEEWSIEETLESSRGEGKVLGHLHKFKHLKQWQRKLEAAEEAEQAEEETKKEEQAEDALEEDAGTTAAEAEEEEEQAECGAPVFAALIPQEELSTLFAHWPY